MLQLIVHFEHLVMGVVHVHAQAIQHFVLSGHLGLEVFIFILDVLDDSSQLVQSYVLLVDHLPLRLQKLL